MLAASYKNKTKCESSLPTQVYFFIEYRLNFLCI